MRSDTHTREIATKPRRPSFPEFVYHLANSVGITGYTRPQMELLSELCSRIRNQQIACRPSHLEEFARRALHALGASGMSDAEMRAFIRECQEGY